MPLKGVYHERFKHIESSFRRAKVNGKWLAEQLERFFIHF